MLHHKYASISGFLTSTVKFGSIPVFCIESNYYAYFSFHFRNSISLLQDWCVVSEDEEAFKQQLGIPKMCTFKHLYTGC